MDLKYFCDEWLNAWTGNKPEHLRSFYSDDAFYRDPVLPKGVSGADLLPYFKKLLAKNPRWIWTAVELLPTPTGFCLKWKAEIPVGETAIYEIGLDIVDVHDGKIVRNEVYFNTALLLSAMNKKI